MTLQPQRARELFADVIEEPPQDRAAFLVAACGADVALRRRVEELLAAHDGSVAAVPERTPGGEQAGDRIGHYKLLEKIGEGGFGTVWMAEQEAPIRRKVALKILKWGMDTAQVVARFAAERQALALMDHPHIARVFDGGATDKGRPYFVMELVRGVPITRYCDEAMLHPGDRLQLFQRVCEAVQHAHQKGVIHRDLKPSNVLVTLHDGRPVPKVIDFGIAKATHGQLTDRTVFTGFQQMLGTPEYMAPEQAEMSGLDVDTRADIYSLGVLLYELLTGTKPFELKDALQAGYQEMLRRIREVDPDKPSTRISTLGERLLDVCKHRRVHPRAFGRLMRGDLDWIVLKALEKERSRRYATAESLAADLERHLRHQPVEAGPPSRVYKLRKYVRRHRVGVVAGLAIAASLAVGAVVSRMGYAEAKEQEARAFAAARQAHDQEQAAVLARQQESEQRQRAEAREREARREAEKTGGVVRLLKNLLGSSDPGRGKGKDYTVRQLLADFDRDLQGLRDLDPEVEATLRDVIGDSYLGLNLPEKAEPHVRRALALSQALFGEHSLEHRISLCQLAQWHFQTSNTDRTRTTEHLNASVALLEKALASPDRSSPEGRFWFAVAAHDIALSLRYLGRLAEAQDWLQQMLECVQPDQHPDLFLDSLWMLADIHEERGDAAGARLLLRRAVSALRAQQSAGVLLHPSTLGNLAASLREDGDLDRALELAEAALALSRERDEDPVSLGIRLRTLAATHEQRGQLAAADARLQEAIALVREVPGGGQRLLAALLGDLADLRDRQSRMREAETLFREAYAIQERTTESGHFELGAVAGNFAKFLSKVGQHDEAVRVRRRAVAILESWHGKGSLAALDQHRALADTLGEAGQHDEAIEEAKAALSGFEALLGPDHAKTQIARLVRARWLFGSGARAEAEAGLPPVLAYMHGRTAANVAAVDRTLVTHALLLAEDLRDAHVTRPAVALASAATAVQSLSTASRPVSTANCMRRLAYIQTKHGDLASARDNLRAAWDLLRAPAHASPEAVRELAWFGQTWVELAERSKDPRDRATAEQVATEAMSAIAATKGLVCGVAECKRALADLLMDDHRYREARPLLEEALADLRERGVRTGLIELTQQWLGLVLLRLEQHAAAEAQLRPLLPFFERRPDGGRDLANVRSVLAEVLYRLDRLDEAEALAQPAVQYSRVQHEHSPDKDTLGSLRVDLSRLVCILGAQERFAEAEALATENVALWRQAEGEKSTEHAAALHGLARVLHGLGRSAEAVAHLRQALAIVLASDQVDGRVQSLASSIEGDLALRSSELGQHQEAQALARSRLERLQSRLPADDLKLAPALASLARVLLAQDPASTEAETLLRRGLAIRTAKSPDAWQRCFVMTLLGGCLLAQGRLEEAEPLLRKSAEQMSATASSDARRIACTHMALLCDQKQQPQDAAAWRAKAAAVSGRGE